MEIVASKLPIIYRKRPSKVYFYLLYIQLGHIIYSEACKSYFVWFKIIHQCVECKTKTECDRVIREMVKEYLEDVLKEEI